MDLVTDKKAKEEAWPCPECERPMEELKKGSGIWNCRVCDVLKFEGEAARSLGAQIRAAFYEDTRRRGRGGGGGSSGRSRREVKPGERQRQRVRYEQVDGAPLEPTGRTEKVQVRLTPQEVLSARRLARELGCSFSDVLRRGLQAPGAEGVA